MNQGAPLTDSAVDESLQYSVLVVVVGFLFLCFFFFTISTTALLVYTCLYECIFVFIYLHVESKAGLVCSRCRRLRCHSRKLHLTPLVASMMHREKAISKQQ